MPRKLVIIQAAALGYDFLREHRSLEFRGRAFQPIHTVFPALTCTAQASFRTALPPDRHGMVANGLYNRSLGRPMFWEQSSALVDGPRIWEAFRRKGRKVAMLFWQQSIGEAVDMLLSPAPIHKHGSGMIDTVYSRPEGLYEDLCRRMGSKFRLMAYWGPFASTRASHWIAAATAELLQGADAPDLCLTYLPALDYDLQRYGPDHPKARAALSGLFEQLERIDDAARKTGHDVMIFGDYAIGNTRSAAYPNRILRNHDLLATRSVRGMAYPVFPASRAFALVDHEVAHVYVREANDIPAVRRAFEGTAGIGQILSAGEIAASGLRNPRTGDLVLVAADGSWFAYPWWTDHREAPDYAGHVDIHNKPGYDPCELFLGWPPGTVSRDPLRIQGSHGRVGEDRRTAWLASGNLPGTPATLLELAGMTRQWLEDDA